MTSPLDSNAELGFLLAQLERSGYTVEDLVEHQRSGAGAATFDEIRSKALDAVSNTNSHDTMKTYLTYLLDGHDGEVCICACARCDTDRHCGTDACVSNFGGIAALPIRSITIADVERAARIRAAIAASGPRKGDGSGAATHVVTAARHLVRVALKDKLIVNDPLAGMSNPKRSTKRTARSFEPEVFERIVDELCMGGDDSELDTLLVVFRLETGARSGGERNLLRSGLHAASCRVTFDEKRGRTVDKPVSRWLMDALLAHVDERGDPEAGPDGPVFHYRPDAAYQNYDATTKEWTTRRGFHPVGKSRFETINRRIRRAVPEAEEAGFRLHDLRHHVSSIIEARFGTAAAAAYLNHTPDSPTAHYTRTRDAEIDRQHQWLTADGSEVDSDRP
jgi:integrase